MTEYDRPMLAMNGMQQISSDRWGFAPASLCCYVSALVICFGSIEADGNRLPLFYAPHEVGQDVTLVSWWIVFSPAYVSIFRHILSLPRGYRISSTNLSSPLEAESCLSCEMMP